MERHPAPAPSASPASASPVMTLPYAGSADTTYWRRAAASAAVACIVFLAFDACFRGFEFWRIWSGDPAYEYASQVIRQLAGAGVELSLVGAVLAFAALGIAGAGLCLIRRDGRALLVLGLLAASASSIALAAIRAWSWSVAFPNAYAGWGHLAMWMAEAVRHDVPKVVMAALIMLQWRNPGVAQALSRGR